MDGRERSTSGLWLSIISESIFSLHCVFVHPENIWSCCSIQMLNIKGTWMLKLSSLKNGWLTEMNIKCDSLRSLTDMC